MPKQWMKSCYSDTQIHTDIDRQLEAKVTRPSRASDLVELGWKGRSDGSARDKIKASSLAERIQTNGLLDALAVFVREMRNKHDGKLPPGHLVNRREDPVMTQAQSIYA